MADYSYGEERKRKKEAEGLFVEGGRGLSQGRNSKGETMCERRYLDRGEGEEYFSLSESDKANERRKPRKENNENGYNYPVAYQSGVMNCIESIGNEVVDRVGRVELR